MNHLIFDTIATLVQLSMTLLGDGLVEEIVDAEDIVESANEFFYLMTRTTIFRRDIQI